MVAQNKEPNIIFLKINDTQSINIASVASCVVFI